MVNNSKKYTFIVLPIKKIIMRNLIIEGDKQKPNLEFLTSGKLSISGQSLPENVASVYASALDWIKEYTKSPAAETTLTFKMKYYNTASSKIFFSIIKELNTLYKMGMNIEIFWHYQEDDTDMLDAGEYFKDLVEIPFNFVEY